MAPTECQWCVSISARFWVTGLICSRYTILTLHEAAGPKGRLRQSRLIRDWEGRTRNRMSRGDGEQGDAEVWRRPHPAQRPEDLRAPRPRYRLNKQANATRLGNRVLLLLLGHRLRDSGTNQLCPRRRRVGGDLERAATLFVHKQIRNKQTGPKHNTKGENF